MSALDLLRSLLAERRGGEVRPQQAAMVGAVEHAIASSRHLVVQAGTGTGKTLGYLVPAVDAGARVVVATATKQLGEQVVREDLPLLARLVPEVAGREVTWALLKGRQNYACRYKVADLLALQEAAPGTPAAPAAEALFDLPAPTGPHRPGAGDAAGLARLLEWVQETGTGDRSEAPATTERVWGQVSTDAAGCLGARACPFVRECFAERARTAARAADVVVTSHAQLAHDLRSPSPLLGSHDLVVLDEAHEVESVLTSAWGHEVAAAELAHAVASASRSLPRGRRGDTARGGAARAAADLAALDDAVGELLPGVLPALPGPVAGLLRSVAEGVAGLAGALQDAGDAEGVPVRLAVERRSAAGRMTEAHQAVTEVLACGPGAVRWLEAREPGRGPVLRVAPLEVGPRLVERLGDRTLVATSATVTAGGTFDAVVRTLGLAGPPLHEDGASGPVRGFDTLDVGSPFDHDRQAMLYVPPASFPSPTGPDRADHAAAVVEELTALVRAAGGRTLALFTSRRAAEAAAVQLRSRVTTPVLVQGQAPAPQLLREFTEVEEATLCATMGFWHGVDVPGPSLCCVVIDKIPFPPAGHPLASARRAAADAAGRDGFTEVYVAAASTRLAQGAGRLVRSSSDRGVVAVLDPRLRTRAYGEALLRDLPPMRRFADRAVVEAALVRLTGGTRAEAVPVPGTAPGAPTAALPPDDEEERAPVRRAAPRRSATRALSRAVRGRVPGSAA